MGRAHAGTSRLLRSISCSKPSHTSIEMRRVGIRSWNPWDSTLVKGHCHQWQGKSSVTSSKARNQRTADIIYGTNRILSQVRTELCSHCSAAYGHDEEKPANSLTRGEAQEHAFNILKKYLINPPVLHLPTLQRPFILETDACREGLGMILIQEYDGIRYPIAFASCTLLP